MKKSSLSRAPKFSLPSYPGRGECLTPSSKNPTNRPVARGRARRVDIFIFPPRVFRGCRAERAPAPLSRRSAIDSASRALRCAAVAAAGGGTGFFFFI